MRESTEQHVTTNSTKGELGRCSEKEIENSQPEQQPLTKTRKRKGRKLTLVRNDRSRGCGRAWMGTWMGRAARYSYSK